MFPVGKLIVSDRKITNRLLVSSLKVVWRRPASSDAYRHEQSLYPLTKDETLWYLQSGLGIQNPEKSLKDDRAAFLVELMRRMKQSTPFTNIPFASSREGPALLPLHQCKESMLSLKGGNCMVINSFLKAVLDNLGFQTHQIMGSVSRWRDPLVDNHTAVIVRHLSHEGSRHLVDVGNQFHLCAPVLLNFRRISPEFETRGKTYRYFQVSSGIVTFCEEVKEDDVTSEKFQQIFTEDEKHWAALMTLRTTAEGNLSDALEVNRLVLETKDVTGVFNDLLLIGYHDDLRVSISRRRCTMIAPNSTIESETIHDKDELTETVFKFFPQFSVDEVQNTISNIDQECQKRQHKTKSE